MKAVRTLSLLAIAIASSTAFAGAVPPSNEVPEPGTWALIALAGAIGVVVARNKRK
jgi:hypothetical protein